MKSNIKMIDIARQLGLSRSTVSRALADSPLINTETRKRVKELSEQLGFRADLNARSMITQKSNIIGCLVYSLAYNAPLASILEVVQERLKSLNYELYIVSGANDPELQSYLVDRMLSRRVDGVILVPPPVNPITRYEPLNMVIQAGVPCTVFGYYFDCPLNQVCVDLFLTGYTIGRHLIDIGHKNIATVYLDADDPRIAGMKKALSESGMSLPEKYFIQRKPHKYGEPGFKSNCDRLCKKIIESGASAVFVDSDYVSVYAVNSLKKLGVSVPSQIAVATAGNSLPLNSLTPSITSYEWPYDLLADTLADVIVEAVEKPSAPVKHINLPGSLVIRESTCS
ncbi:MAG: LacI family DNA-binding transcriptional regulator [Sedimentisphaeraceae bacterium JB056]